MKNFHHYIRAMFVLVFLAALVSLITIVPDLSKSSTKPTAPSPNASNSFPIQVHGAVERERITKSLQISETQGQYWVNLTWTSEEKNELNSVALYFPADAPSGTYTVQGKSHNKGDFWATYYELDHNVIRNFEQNVSGTLVLTRNATQISGKLEFRAKQNGSESWITVTSEFSFLPEQHIQKVAYPIMTIAMPFIIVGFIILFITNVVFFLYVGTQVYQGQSMFLLRLLNVKKTFTLGIREPKLRGVMIAWFIVIMGTGLSWIFYILSSTWLVQPYLP